MIKIFNSLLVTMFGIGKIKFAPGTFGSLATTIILFYLFHSLNVSSNIILVGLIIIFIYSFYAVSTHIENSKNKDPGEIVIDELLGQSIPIYLYEVSHGTSKENGEVVISYILFFFLFRYFDIAKPFPVNFFDKNFKNSFGVIMDDICAGLYVVLTVICFMVIKNYVL
ncbi:phosphatidylglycerophosphatase A [Candidatus Pelagibacter sp.]|jgi:phosphatidylglycerophosphatase A|nr:phosphatidylglycerophosphatase A [Candidatus Pelagibacter sp.]|tara:strand:+ start:324 stop:827 length:504 start_codon:yes stop_codon:yes gene_type:complete